MLFIISSLSGKGAFRLINEKKDIKRPHNIIIENRQKLNVSGITEIGSFDEQIVILSTDYGNITIRGNNLNINTLSVDTGELSMEGEIDDVVYSYSSNKGGNLFSRLFK